MTAPINRSLALAVLGAGVLVVSSASILIRYAMEAGVAAISIAALRLTIAALVLAPFAAAIRPAELRGLGLAQWGLAIGAGALLALHFASWIVSLEYTSVASSVALVTTNPIWIGLGSWLLLREPLAVRMIVAIALALAGSLAIFATDQDAGSAAGANPALGNALAVIGSLAMCGYLLIGRKLRAGVSLLAYVSVVYAVAALFLLLAAAAWRAPVLAIPSAAWLLVAALALGPQLLGHSAFNWALRHFPATVVAIAILGEPIGSTILAWLLLDEPVGAAKLGAMVLLLSGIVLASWPGRGAARA